MIFKFSPEGQLNFERSLEVLNTADFRRTMELRKKQRQTIDWVEGMLHKPQPLENPIISGGCPVATYRK